MSRNNSNTNRTHPGGADSSESTETSEIAENQDKTIPFQDGANTSWEPKAKRVRIGADSSECGQGKSEASEDAENLKKTDADHNTSGRQKISFNRIPTDEWVRRRWLKWLGQYYFINTKDVFVCSDHFTPDCFRTPVGEKARKRFKCSAIPSIRKPFKTFTRLREPLESNSNKCIIICHNETSTSRSTTGCSSDDSGISLDVSTAADVCSNPESDIIHSLQCRIAQLEEENAQLKREVENRLDEKQASAKIKSILSPFFAENQVDKLAGTKKRELDT
ncbi:THAP domain-containing protein 2-like [Culex pipiens pallens]|uniref:THAP domain-containing protein 2-like n=1 Tax=Culex pipiens pallens TaxID=42434 RepID=UPI0022AADCC8|nr:THAP domain-containing protein 2-like [Culex pipiens pallens]